MHVQKLGIGISGRGRLLSALAVGSVVLVGLVLVALDGVVGWGLVLGGAVLGFKVWTHRRLAAWTEGSRLTMRMAYRTFVFDLSTADVRLDWRRSVVQAAATVHGSPASMPVAGPDLPALFLRAGRGDEWKVLGLHTSRGRVLPPAELIGLAAVLRRYRPGDPAADGLDRLADTHDPYAKR